MKKIIKGECPNCNSDKIYKFNLALISFYVFAIISVFCLLSMLLTYNRMAFGMAFICMFTITIILLNKLLFDSIKNRKVIQLKCSECGSTFVISKDCLEYKEIANSNEKE